jgi:acyl-CoA thioesterase FadM
MSWLETYRGTVNQWEVDNVGHFTVAYYFARFEDATLALLDAVGLGGRAVGGAGLACRVERCDVRYLRELRVADLLHVRSAIVGVDQDGIVLAHEVYDSADGTLCTTVHQRAHVVGAGGAPRALTPAQRAAIDAHSESWEPPADAPGAAARPALPESDAGFVESARDALRPWEADAHGEAGWPAYVHRFSAANGHALAAFGMTPAYMREQHRGLSTFEFRLAWPGVLRAGDLVSVRTGLLHVGTSSMRLLHRMRDARTGRVVATLEQAGVHLDLDARRPAPLPDALRERARALLVG